MRRSTSPTGTGLRALALIVPAGLVLALGSCALVAPLTTDGTAGAEERPTSGDDPASDRDAERPSTATVAWQEVAAGQQSAVRIPVARSITDPGLWADFWAAIHANETDPPPRPEVDLDNSTIVFLNLGERRTGGYAVGIEQILERRGAVEVVIRVDAPAEGAMVTQALTSPYYIASLPVTDTAVVFTGDDLETGFSLD